jgi:predicted enzyme related to lactoylglutathione lyase
MPEARQHGTFAWNELATNDPERAMDFFRSTLGWEFEKFALEEGPYWVANANGVPVGGIGGMATGAVAAAEPYWFAFIEVDDVDRRIDVARAERAVILRPPHDVPGVGRVAVLRDPSGAAIGWMTGLKPD